MKKFVDGIKKVITKHGVMIAGLAMFMVTMSANSPCTLPLYEPDVPKGIERFKR